MNGLNRRGFLKRTTQATLGLMATSAVGWSDASQKSSAKRPNILFAISDDQSWPHTGAYGSKMVRSPGFDRVARTGCLLNNAFCAAPQCAPNRASILTGRSIWQNEEAGTHSSYFPKKLTVFTDVLEESGYFIGTTGKSWGPGNWKDSGWKRNPAGPGYDKRKLTPPAKGIKNLDYAANFVDFMDERPEDQPFFFWYGAYEPHRSYEKGIGLKMGKKLEDAVVPPFLPDTQEIRSDLLDYAVECEWFDQHLCKILDTLEEAGELDNTLVIVTSDNGMPFPRAKANLYEYGLHMPMAVSWPKGISGGRKIDDLVSFIDLAPTFLEAAGIDAPQCMSGRSFMNVLQSKKSGVIDKSRKHIMAGRERHSHSRFDNQGYPSRVIRTDQYLYIRNLKPELWPAGDPPYYHDIDACPTNDFMIENKDKYQELANGAYGKRPLEELYDIRKDPGCMNNLVNDAQYAATRENLWNELKSRLISEGDPRMSGSEIFDSYPRFGSMRQYLGGFWKKGQYNPKYK